MGIPRWGSPIVDLPYLYFTFTLPIPYLYLTFTLLYPFTLPYLYLTLTLPYLYLTFTIPLPYLYLYLTLHLPYLTFTLPLPKLVLTRISHWDAASQSKRLPGMQIFPLGCCIPSAMALGCKSISTFGVYYWDAIKKLETKCNWHFTGMRHKFWGMLCPWDASGMRQK